MGGGLGERVGGWVSRWSILFGGWWSDEWASGLAWSRRWDGCDDEGLDLIGWLRSGGWRSMR